ncbi:MAG: hypothetical protein NTU59_01880 [Coprothermobacterota bacterium]|nr:hypothetical protein [Coprothermobacterota bacterium]
MEPIDLDAQLKRALSHLAESAPIRQPPLQDLLARGRKQQRRSRLALVFSPLAAILLFLAVTAFPVFAGAQNLAQWWTERQLEQAFSVWDSISPVGSLLAIQFHCDLAMVNNLLAQGVSPQEVALRAEVANASGLSLWEITALRGQGLGWGRIIEELGLERKVILGQLAPLTPSNPENIQIPGVTPSTSKTSSSPQSFFSQTATGLPTSSPTSDAGLPIDPSPSAGNGSSDHPSTPPATPGSPSEPPSESQGTPSSQGGTPTTTPSGQGGTPTTTPSGPGGPSTSTPTSPGGQPTTTPSSPGGPPTSTPTGLGGPPTGTPSGPGGPPTAPPSPSPSPPEPGPGPNPSPGSKPKP